METTHCVFHDPISVKQSYKIFHFSFFTYIGDFSLFVFHLSLNGRQPFFTLLLFYLFTFKKSFQSFHRISCVFKELQESVLSNKVQSAHSKESRLDRKSVV